MASLPPASLQPGGATSTSLHRHTARVTFHTSHVTCHVSRGPPQTVLEDEAAPRHGGHPQPRHQQAAQPEGGGDPGAVPGQWAWYRVQGDRVSWVLSTGDRSGAYLVSMLVTVECGGLSGQSSGQWTASHPRHPGWALLGSMSACHSINTSVTLPGPVLV